MILKLTKNIKRNVPWPRSIGTYGVCRSKMGVALSGRRRGRSVEIVRSFCICIFFLTSSSWTLHLFYKKKFLDTFYIDPEWPAVIVQVSHNNNSGETKKETLWETEQGFGRD